MSFLKKNKKSLLIIASVLVFGIISLFLYIKSNTHIYFNYEDKQTITLEYQQTLEKPVSACFHTPFKDDVQLDVLASNTLPTDKLGNFEISYEASYQDLKAQLTLNYQIIDTTAPVIELVINEDYYTNYGDDYIEEGFSAYDNFDGDLSEQVIRSIENDIVTYSVSDSSNNTTTITRTIKYKDLQAPVLTLNGASSIAVLVNGSYSEPGYKALDNMDGDLTSKVVVSSNLNTNSVGTYTITYSVSDTSGNKTSTKRTIYVYQKQTSNAKEDAAEKIIYLTFDDGPSQYTARLLDILDKYNIKVTFFVTNTSKSYVNEIGDAYRRGHSIGVHSKTHNFAIYTSSTTFWNDFNQMNDIIKQQTGQTVNLFRFPGGTSNTLSKKYATNIMATLVNEATAKGYRYCDWNVSSGDGGGTTDTNKIIDNVKKGCSKYKVSWVLMHDSHGYSVDAVEEIILWGLSNGYTFLPITDGSKVTHHKPSN